MNKRSSLCLKALRALLSGESHEVFVFKAPLEKTIKGLDNTNLYLHIPFCRNHCFYCPYNTVPFNPEKVGNFFAALRTELSLYRSYEKFAEGNSLYIGGGTPGCCGDALFDFISFLKENIGKPREIAIEMNPEEVTPEFVAKLKTSSITQVSLGVQSFDDDILHFLGRSYTSDILPARIGLLNNAGFENLNVDIMFAFKGQTEAAFKHDLKRAIALGASQITAYPFFNFPHTHEDGKLQSLVMPPLRQRRRMYRVLWETMHDHDYEMVSVWGFRKKTQEASFSSVSRDNFVGFGPGAASKLHDIFRFNTFDLETYITACHLKQSACSLEMPLSENLETLYRLYWRFYEGVIPSSILNSGLKRKRLWRFIFWSLRSTGFVTFNKAKRSYRLTERGAFWIHLLQNYYILNYIDHVWQVSMTSPNPQKIELQ